MFEGEFTGDWVYADGEWHQEIHDPIDLGHLQWVPTYAGVGLAISAFGSWLVTEQLLYSVDHMGKAATTDWSAVGSPR